MIIGTPYDFAQAGYAFATTSPIRSNGTISSRFPGRARPESIAGGAGKPRRGAGRGPHPGNVSAQVPEVPSPCRALRDRALRSHVVHQRVAATFRKGRILLAGDAAHLNSPIGAMGMNSGIHDAVNLAAICCACSTARRRKAPSTAMSASAAMSPWSTCRPRPSPTRRTWSSAIRRRGRNIATRCSALEAIRCLRRNS